MQLQLSKNICECLLKDGLISNNTIENKDRFELMVEDLLGCFPKYKNGDKHVINNLKKKIGKMLSIKAKVMKINEQQLKSTKFIIYEIINKKITDRKNNGRKLKIGKKREIYSSDQSQSQDGEMSKNKVTQIFPEVKIQPKIQCQQEQDSIQNENQSECSQQQKQKKQQEECQLQQTVAIGKQKQHKKPRTKRIIKRKYKCFDQDFKQDVCKYMAEHGTQATQKKYNLSMRKITSWFSSYKLNILGKGRKAMDPAMEFNMSVWLLKKIWNRIPLTQKIIRQKAATMKTIKNRFTGSKGWLQKYFLRHVQIKSCFDYRNKIETREQCAKYHRQAYARLLHDYQTLRKLATKQPIIDGDFQQIIYGGKNHHLLKPDEDKNLDKLKRGKQLLYDFVKLETLPTIDRNLIKIQQKYRQQQQQLDQIEKQQSEQEYDNQSDDEEQDDSSEEEQIKDQESCSSLDEQIEIYEEDDTDQNKMQIVKKQESFI